MFQAGNGSHYTLAQAVSQINKNTQRHWEKADLVKLVAQQKLELLCYVRNLPLIQPEYQLVRDDDGLTGQLLRDKIKCFTGFFNPSLTDDGLKYVHKLAHGEELKAGICMIELDSQTQNIADLVAFADSEGMSEFGYSCETIKAISDAECFRYIPTGEFRPSLESFYVERFWLESLIDRINREDGNLSTRFQQDFAEFLPAPDPVVRMIAGKDPDKARDATIWMLKQMQQYACTGGYSIGFPELWEKHKADLTYTESQRKTARTNFYRWFEEVNTDTN